MGDRKSTVIDTIVRLSRSGTSSTWQGEKGLYRFMKREGDDGPRKPHRRVFLNRKYLTGIFRTHENDRFSGDIRMSDGSIRRILLDVMPDDSVTISLVEAQDTPRTRHNAHG